MRVLIADDSAFFRRLLSDVLSSIPDVQVVGSAANGKLALQKVRELSPDLLTLDIEMPELDGLAVLDALFRQGQRSLDILVVSSSSPRAGELTIKALQKGAFDFVFKPEAADPDRARRALIADVAPRIRAISHRLEVRAILGGGQPRHQLAPSLAGESDAVATGESLHGIAKRMQRLSNPGKPELLLIGVSTGGPQALGRLLPAIPRDIGVPIIIVQHMPPLFTKSLAESLSARCAVSVQEAIHDEPVRANTAYIAPGGRQMSLGAGTDGHPVLKLTDDPPENNCRPAVDYLFRSAANRFPGRSMAVILTGMGNDGTLGLRLLKRHGCYAIAQDEASCVVYGMPKSVVEAGLTDAVLPLESIASRIITVLRGGIG